MSCVFSIVAIFISIISLYFSYLRLWDKERAEFKLKIQKIRFDIKLFFLSLGKVFSKKLSSKYHSLMFLKRMNKKN